MSTGQVRLQSETRLCCPRHLRHLQQFGSVQTKHTVGFFFSLPPALDLFPTSLLSFAIVTCPTNSLSSVLLTPTALTHTYAFLDM